MIIDCLTDRSKMMIAIINVQIPDRSSHREFKVNCGAYWFRGGLSGWRKVSGDGREFEVLVPERIKNVNTELFLCSQNDDLELVFRKV